jgi:hypothetical protein
LRRLIIERIHAFLRFRPAAEPALIHLEIVSFFGGTVPHSGHRSGVARRS